MVRVDFWVVQTALANSYSQDTQHPRRHFHSGCADTPIKAANKLSSRNIADAVGDLQVVEYQPWAF